MKYADKTRNTRNPIKRIAHSRRFAQAAALIPLSAEQKILDYGCGDGVFFEHLAKYVPVENLYGYDPGLLQEMTFKGATTYEDTETLIPLHRGTFDVLYCMEVCEHLSHEKYLRLFTTFGNWQKMMQSLSLAFRWKQDLAAFQKTSSDG